MADGEEWETIIAPEGLTLVCWLRTGSRTFESCWAASLGLVNVPQGVADCQSLRRLIHRASAPIGSFQRCWCCGSCPYPGLPMVRLHLLSTIPKPGCEFGSEHLCSCTVGRPFCSHDCDRLQRTDAVASGTLKTSAWVDLVWIGAITAAPRRPRPELWQADHGGQPAERKPVLAAMIRRRRRNIVQPDAVPPRRPVEEVRAIAIF